MVQENIANIISELIKLHAEVTARFLAIKDTIKLDTKKQRVKYLNTVSEQPDFWQDVQAAGLLQKEKIDLEKELNKIASFEQQINDTKEFLSLLTEENVNEVIDLKEDFLKIEAELSMLEIQLLLSKPHDKSSAILSINVGQGGVDSQDFAEILLRMYKRYAERQGFEIELIDIQAGEEAGIKSATLFISGEYAYGYLKAEIGVHRLVRISPFDANSRRHTSFASVWVIPQIEEDIAIDIKPEDLRIDTYRAGGAGGQHVNKTDSAIRITHLTSGVVVACQSERSQIKNRATAMKLLRSKLYDLEMKKRLAAKDKAEAAKMEASFGSQIRNYVMAPYRLVKDLRTGYEVGNVDAILDGEIQPFIKEYLLAAQHELTK
jgi:peptide chain release factor 2